MALGEIKQLSDNWIRPRMDERMQEFSRRVQQKLRDLATKGLTPTSPHIYQGLLDLAREELELRGRIVCEGYERVLRTLDCDMPRGLEVEIRAELETWMVNTAVQVRDVLRPIQESRKLTNGPELTDLRWPVVNKVAAELDILFAGLRARRRQQSSETSQGTPAPAPQTSTDGKRSKDLLRLLLLKVRDKAQPKQLVEYPDAQQIQHAAMLINDGLVSGRAVRGRHGKYESAIMTELTSKGHDFLDDFEEGGTGGYPFPSSARNSPEPESLRRGLSRAEQGRVRDDEVWGHKGASRDCSEDS